MKLRLALLATLTISAAYARPSEKFRSLDGNGDDNRYPIRYGVPM